MKKVFLALTLLLVSLVGNAQVNHLKFAGIPIDGTQESFETQLINKKGFRKVMWKGQPFLEGSFLNETVMVQTALGPRTGKVAFVTIHPKKEHSGQSILHEVDRWKGIIQGTHSINLNVQGNYYKGEMNSPSLGRGRIGLDCVQSDPANDLYVVRIVFVDSENIGK